MKKSFVCPLRLNVSLKNYSLMKSDSACFRRKEEAKIKENNKIPLFWGVSFRIFVEQNVCNYGQFGRDEKCVSAMLNHLKGKKVHYKPFNHWRRISISRGTRERGDFTCSGCHVTARWN